jgi:heme/copper-type cytochrome/quinol oxidase subunit 2
MSWKLIVGAVATVFQLTAALTGHAQNSNAGQSDASQVVELTAKKYEFSPNEIRVKKGARVRLKVHSTDEDHGMKFSLYPERSKDKSTPGLVFDSPQDNGKVDKGSDQMLEFVAQRAGTYEFKCAVFCGIHHGRMKGKLVVEE